MSKDDYNEMIQYLEDKMERIKKDPDFLLLKKIYSAKIPTGNPIMDLQAEQLKRLLAYPMLIKNFTSGGSRRGSFDAKPEVKDQLDSSYSKTEKNKEGKPSVHFGYEAPWDKERILDHDIIGNILYAWIMKDIGVGDYESRVGAWVDDLKHLSFANIFNNPDDEVIKGTQKYLNRGKPLNAETIDKIHRDLDEKGKLTTYKKEDLIPRSYRAEEGETVKEFCEREGISIEEMKALLERESKISDIYKGIDEYTKLKAGQKINRPWGDGLMNKDKESQGLNSNQGQAADAKAKAAAPGKELPAPAPAGDGRPSPVSLLPAAPAAQAAPVRSAETEAKVQSLLSQIEKHDNKNDYVLYKKAEDITEQEIYNARKHAWYETNDRALQTKLNNKVQNWYDTVYGTEPQERDATGRGIEPRAKIRLKTESVEPKTKDNIPLRQAYKEVAESAVEKGVKGLQRGLNDFEYNPKLKEDDVLGPKTVARTKEVLADYGTAALRNKLRGDDKEALPCKEEPAEPQEAEPETETEAEAQPQPQPQLTLVEKGRRNQIDEQYQNPYAKKLIV